jgi:hypothetical protein
MKRFWKPAFSAAFYMASTSYKASIRGVVFEKHTFFDCTCRIAMKRKVTSIAMLIQFIFVNNVEFLMSSHDRRCQLNDGSSTSLNILARDMTGVDGGWSLGSRCRWSGYASEKLKSSSDYGHTLVFLSSGLGQESSA